MEAYRNKCLDFIESVEFSEGGQKKNSHTIIILPFLKEQVVMSEGIQRCKVEGVEQFIFKCIYNGEQEMVLGPCFNV